MMKRGFLGNRLVLAMLMACLWACESKQAELPYLGPKTTRVVQGKTDTLYHKIQDFQLLDQDGKVFGSADLKGKVWVADFFFSTCPTICPRMKTQLLRLHERYRNQAKLQLVSISIDPEHDQPRVLKAYAQRLQAQTQQWHFLTGERSYNYALAQKSFLVSAGEDPEALGGFIHSGAFILIDANGHPRAMVDGTQEEEVNALIEKIEQLLDEK